MLCGSGSAIQPGGKGNLLCPYLKTLLSLFNFLNQFVAARHCEPVREACPLARCLKTSARNLAGMERIVESDCNRHPSLVYRQGHTKNLCKSERVLAARRYFDRPWIYWTIEAIGDVNSLSSEILHKD